MNTDGVVFVLVDAALALVSHLELLQAEPVVDDHLATRFNLEQEPVVTGLTLLRPVA